MRVPQAMILLSDIILIPVLLNRASILLSTAAPIVNRFLSISDNRTLHNLCCTFWLLIVAITSTFPHPRASMMWLLPTVTPNCPFLIGSKLYSHSRRWVIWCVAPESANHSLCVVFSDCSPAVTNAWPEATDAVDCSLACSAFHFRQSCFMWPIFLQ